MQPKWEIENDSLTDSQGEHGESWAWWGGALGLNV